MKTQDKNQFEAPERKHYKKRYLVRKAEEVEANKEIETFERDQEIETPIKTDRTSDPIS